MFVYNTLLQGQCYMNGYTIFFTITSKAKQVIDGLLLVCIW